ncbi:hypothetical protein NHQ30_003803 [Ciborinia camelliae]|nr:hypothetical protein NHQ30_003803 [Ciborinia camelliae]
MNATKSCTPKKGQKQSSDWTASQQSNNEKLTAGPITDAPKTKGRPRKDDDAAASVTKEKGVDNGGKTTNVKSATAIRRWTQIGKSTKASISYKEQSGSEEEPPLKRQKQNNATQHEIESSSSPQPSLLPVQARTTLNPQTITPKEKQVKTPQTPQKAKKDKPPKGVYIRTKYISNPAAVFIHPIEVVHKDMKDFTWNGEGELVYQGEADKESGLLKWTLGHRIIAKPGYPERELTDPPKETLKKWRAYCAFRGLDPTGTREEMQQRLRVYFDSAVYARDTPKYEAKMESERVRKIIDTVKRQRKSFDVSWKMRNEAERTRLWGLLSAEEQFEKNISLFITENISGSRSQDVWFFKTRPKLSAEVWTKFFEEEKYPDIGLVFTTYPQSADSDDKAFDIKYQRGKLEQALYLKPYLGGTWVGTGFEEGMILGRTQELVKQIIEEKCEQIRKSIIGRYVKHVGNANGENGKCDFVNLFPKTNVASSKLRAVIKREILDSRGRTKGENSVGF